MKTMGEVNAEFGTGQLVMFDRILFQGHLSGLYPLHRFEQTLYHQGILLKEFGEFAQASTKRLKAHLEEMAQAEGRPLLYLPTGYGKQKESKEAMAQGIAEQDQIEEGLIAIFSCLEMDSTLSVRRQQESGHIRLVSERRKQLHYYLYYQDAEFGLMHLRLQSWWPFRIQIYINGREWLAKALEKEGIAFVRADNCFWEIADLEQAQALCDKFAHRQWARVWNAFAARINPLLAEVKAWTGKGYYWSVQQAEIATDLMFSEIQVVEDLVPELFRAAQFAFAGEDVMRFLGRKLNGNYQGEIKSDLKKRREGWRLKHWCKVNSIKAYNKGSVLRIETTINKSDEFKIPAPKEQSSRWKRMPKGVSHFWHFYAVGREANQRYFDALCSLPTQGKAAIDALDSLCQSHQHNGRSVAKFQPFTPDTVRLFAAVLHGEHLSFGLRNRHLCERLFHAPAPDPATAQRRRARVSRLLAKLTGHGLLERVERSHLYRITTYGFQVMSAVLLIRQFDFTAHCDLP